LGIVTGSGDIEALKRIDTSTPEETIGAALEWMLNKSSKVGGLAALGIASFGPISLDRASPDYGFITRTTKSGWSHTSFAPVFADAFGVPVGFNTDVNGAALAEHRWGAARGTTLSVYVTIGTGIGGGTIVDGCILQGLSHPEMGHIRLPRHPLDTEFQGVCPFHDDCLEGLASGPAIKARWGSSLSEIPDTHPAHEIIAWYLAQMVFTLQAIMEPARIILGGGVMETPGLINRIQRAAELLGGGYFRGRVDQVIVRPALGDKAGLLGALALAQDALAKQ
jgi:fructokinase